MNDATPARRPTFVLKLATQWGPISWGPIYEPRRCAICGGGCSAVGWRPKGVLRRRCGLHANVLHGASHRLPHSVFSASSQVNRQVMIYVSIYSLVRSTSMAGRRYKYRGKRRWLDNK